MSEPEVPVVPAAPADEEAVSPARQGTPFLVLQFFVFPMAIVAVCVIVFLVFGMIASEGKGAREYVHEVRNGSTNRRWQAAFELSKVIQAGRDPALKDPAFVDDVTKALDEAKGDDPRVRRYLTLTLGRLGDRRAVPSLLRALSDAAPAGAHSDPDTQIYSLWALGTIGDPAAAPALLEHAKSEDPGVRKAAVHALGGFATAEARDAVQAALADRVDDVRWNAALALSRHRDPLAVPVLLEMLDRDRLARAEGT
ncbi:MAG TPA: HEAT repeat domain-containing protein, partial [Vicinamibacteria bacterium]|nr:HEAT repeat domain-containing protein [Vicinamibacteria bacterium]